MLSEKNLIINKLHSYIEDRENMLVADEEIEILELCYVLQDGDDQVDYASIETWHLEWIIRTFHDTEFNQQILSKATREYQRRL